MPILARTELDNLIQQATRLNQKLLDLCNKPTESRTVSSLSMSRDFNLLNQLVPLDIIIPIQTSLTPQFPTHPELSAISSSLVSSSIVSASQRAIMYKPFPSDLPTFSSFKDQVDLMNSLVRPKKITVVGSDGREYSFLCKPKDDLRKDSRLMEFNSMINQFLKTNLESRKRNLHIRTYAVRYH